eukprot:scaffold109039_cov59-Phaeocystis_antarctica.AAC.1
MAAGCQDSEIQAALRWSSEDALKIYKVPNAGVYGGGASAILPSPSVHLGANQAWHSLGETGGGAGEACLLAYRSERALVVSRLAAPAIIV